MICHPTDALSIKKLPVEILEHIFDILAEPLHRSDYQDPVHKTVRGRLARCLETCRLFSALARPHLFRLVCLTSDASFDPKRMDSFLRLGSGPHATSPLCYVQVFDFAQTYDCKLEWGVQNGIGSILHTLLDLANEGMGRLRAVAVSLAGDPKSREWGGLDDTLRGAFEKIDRYRIDSLKTLRIGGIINIPWDGIAFPFRITTLTLGFSSVDLFEEDEGFTQSRQAATEDVMLDPGQWNYRAPLSLEIDASPLNLSLIKLLGPQLLSLDIHPGVDGRYKLRTIGSLPATPSTTPSFPRLGKLRIYISTHPTPQTEEGQWQCLIDFGSKQCQHLANIFLVTLPASDAPQLRELEIVFDLSVNCFVGTPLGASRGWVKQRWEGMDEHLHAVLQMHAKRPGAFPLRLSIVFRYEYGVTHGYEEPVVPYFPESEEHLWMTMGLPRVRIAELLPLTSETFAHAVSFREEFSICYMEAAWRPRTRDY